MNVFLLVLGVVFGLVLRTSGYFPRTKDNRQGLLFANDILKFPRAFRLFYKCLMEETKASICQETKMRYVIAVLTDALLRNCARCDRVQMIVAQNLFTYLKTQKQEEWYAIIGKIFFM
uniref:Uncharacterized protein n=1 Tax=Clastoptera arizonana TaxID=38151 RepID=A0A1B6CM52_9HEMI